MLSAFVRLALKRDIHRPFVRLMTSDTLISEESIAKSLQTKFPNAEKVIVEDTSGGCGQSFSVVVICSSFKSKPIVQQHRMVNEALKEQIKSIHAIRIHTALPD